MIFCLNGLGVLEYLNYDLVVGTIHSTHWATNRLKTRMLQVILAFKSIRAVKGLLGIISACCISRVAPWQSVRTLSGQSQVTLISKSWNQISFSQCNAGCATCADDTHETFYRPYTYTSYFLPKMLRKLNKNCPRTNLTLWKFQINLCLKCQNLILTIWIEKIVLGPHNT